MKRDIILYVDNNPVDLSDESFILMNYTEDDADNPTAVINSFSKQISLPLTDNNAKAFENMAVANRITQGNAFNPLNKTPFLITIDGEIFESGYCRLDEVSEEGGYLLTLFGGLGGFMYSLSYFDGADLGSNKSNAKTLADLNFMGSTTPDDEFNFTINADTVRAAWNNIGTGIWEYISFAPMYNGYPKNSDFAKDKGVMVTGQHGIANQQGYSGKYQGTTNYALVNFTHDFTEWEMRDFRSYLQRPVLSIAGFMKAIARPLNNGGWTVDYTEVLNSSEVQHGWISLPMLGEGTPEKTQEMQSNFVQYDAHDYAYIDITPRTDIRAGRAIVKVNVQPNITGVNQGGTTATQQTMYFEAGQILTSRAAMFVQLVAYNSDNNVIGGSDIAFVHGYVPDAQDVSGAAFAKSCGYTPLSPGNYVDIYAAWENTGGGSYRLSKVLNLSCECYGAHHFRVVMTPGYVPRRLVDIFDSPCIGSNARVCWSSLADSGNQYTYTGMFLPVNGIPTITYDEASSTHSGSSITKRTLMGGMPSPGSILAGLCRVCGWKILCDDSTKSVKILPRGVYYDGAVVDIDKRIDRSKNYTIVPNGFSSKFLDFELELYNGSFAEYYSGKYGRAYGSMRVKTGYDFNEEHLKMFDGIAFKHAVTVQENSPYFYTAREKEVDKPAAFRDVGNTYTLWSTEDGTSKDFDLPSLGNNSVLTPLASTQIQTQADAGYDDWFRVQMENNGETVDDGSGVILYFQGFVQTCGQLTDDLDVMRNMLGGKVCWIPFYGDIQISIPSFATYMWASGAGGDIILSSDMAQPREMGMPGVNYLNGVTLYERYWKRYVEDRYSVDAKVCKCYVDMAGLEVGNEMLRHFYWFDECLWSLSKVIDYPVNTDDPCLCEFVRVMDRQAYTDTVTPPQYLIANPESLEFIARGGTKSFAIAANTSWQVQSKPNWVTLSRQSGTGDAVINVSVGTNSSGQQDRSGQIIITDGTRTATVTVNQEGFFLRITKHRAHVPAKGDIVTFDVESNDDWTVASDDPDVTVAPVNGRDYDTVEVTVPENPTLSNKLITITVTGRYGGYSQPETLEITQDHYLFDVTPRQVDMPQPGGTFYLNISTLDTETPWTLQLPTGIIAETTSGSGDARIPITVGANPLDEDLHCDPRELKIKVRFTPVADWWDDEHPIDPEDPDYDPDADPDDDNPAVIPVIVNQEGIPRLSVSPMELHFNEDGGTLQLTVEANEPWTYSAPAWLTITDITPVPDPDDPDYDPDAEVNPNDKLLQVVAAANSSQNSRTAYIAFTSDSGVQVNVLVVQEGKVPRLAVTPSSINFPAAGGNNTVQVTANEPWTYSAPAWLTVTDVTPAPQPGDPVSYDKTLQITAAANSGQNTRVANISFVSDSGLTENLLVSQDGSQAPTLLIYPSSLTFDAEGETLAIQVYSNESWTLTLPAWLTASANSGTGNATIQLTAAANGTGSIRTGFVEAESTSHLTASCDVEQLAPIARYLTFESTGGNTISMMNATGLDMEYSLDGGNTWTQWDFSAVNIPDGGRFLLRGMNAAIGVNSYSYRVAFVFGGSGTVACSGNIMHLFDHTQDLNTIPAWGCAGMFVDCTVLTSAPSLPATNIGFECYKWMFAGCTGLLTAPELPAMTLAVGCYESMFTGCTSLRFGVDLPALQVPNRAYAHMYNGCTSLLNCGSMAAVIVAQESCERMFQNCTSITQTLRFNVSTVGRRCFRWMYYGCSSLTKIFPLLATTMAEECYYEMFIGCTSLVSGPWTDEFNSSPKLPATNLDNKCYYGMFMDCTSLTGAPALPATTMAQKCYYYMFYNCTSLTTAPNLPGDTLASLCYAFMFNDCTSLVNAPALPALTLRDNCYEGMFTGCTSLVNAPALPATALAPYCYVQMFSGCTSMTDAPILPATTLVSNCYNAMFYNCASLSYIKTYTQTEPGPGYTDNWVYGVRGTGTFVKTVTALWGFGYDSIPYGWTVRIETS